MNHGIQIVTVFFSQQTFIQQEFQRTNYIFYRTLLTAITNQIALGGYQLQSFLLLCILVNNQVSAQRLDTFRFLKSQSSPPVQ